MLWEYKAFWLKKSPSDSSGFCLRCFENTEIWGWKKVRVTLADFALDALKRFSAGERRFEIGRSQQNRGFSSCSRMCVRVLVRFGFSQTLVVHVWRLAIVGGSPIGMSHRLFCTFCIGLSQRWRIGIARNWFSNRESDNVTIFEKVFFRLVIKIYV